MATTCTRCGVGLQRLGHTFSAPWASTSTGGTTCGAPGQPHVAASDDARLRADEIRANRDAVLAAAVTWWAEQIAAQDMPEGPERTLTEACDRYVESLGVQFDMAGISVAPPAVWLDELAQRRRGGGS